MSRGLATAAVVAFLLLFVATKTTAAPQVAAQASAASECRWERHSKRVVKRVRRHGKVRRVVHRKHWWTCVPVAAAPAASVPTAPAAPAPQPEPEPEANRLAVKGVEYYFVLSRPSVRAGEVTIELNNQGEDPHNLNLRPVGSSEEPQQIAETDSQQRTVATFDLPAGKYHLWCSLPQHEEKGMATTLVVE
jgi:plastocyanin